MTDTLEESKIKKYLRENPGFFIDNEEVLTELRIPHKEKGTISLIEKQLEISKRKELEAQEQILRFFKNAKENAAIFKKSQSFLRKQLWVIVKTDFSNRCTLQPTHILDASILDYIRK